MLKRKFIILLFILNMFMLVAIVSSKWIITVPFNLSALFQDSGNAVIFNPIELDYQTYTATYATNESNNTSKVTANIELPLRWSDIVIPEFTDVDGNSKGGKIEGIKTKIEHDIVKQLNDKGLIRKDTTSNNDYDFIVASIQNYNVGFSPYNTNNNSGYFSYSGNTNINYVAGSTYLAKISFTQYNSDYKIIDSRGSSPTIKKATDLYILFKYKSVFIKETPDTWYTIEEALENVQSGQTIVTVGSGTNNEYILRTTGHITQIQYKYITDSETADYRNYSLAWSNISQTAFTAIPSDITKYKSSSYDKVEEGKNHKDVTLGYTLNEDTKIIVPYANMNEIQKDKYEYEGEKVGSNVSYTNNTGTAVSVYKGGNSGVVRYSTIYSTLFIPKEVALTVYGTITAGGFLVSSGNIYNRGVIMNNGVIDVSKKSTSSEGGRINGYGYIKSGGFNTLSTDKKSTTDENEFGQIYLRSGCSAMDEMRIYDWLSGRNAFGLVNETLFPFRAYNIHNISCPIRVYSGAIYNVGCRIEASNTLTQTSVVLIGEGGMFTIHNDSYIDKSVKEEVESNRGNFTYPTIYNINSVTASNSVNSNAITTDINNASYGYTATTQTDIMEMHGYGGNKDNPDISDNGVKISVGVNIDTSTYVLPISFMRIIIASGFAKLSNVSYSFLPGSSFTVNEGANLAVGKNITFYTLKDACDDLTYKYTSGGKLTSTTYYIEDLNHIDKYSGYASTDNGYQNKVKYQAVEGLNYIGHATQLRAKDAICMVGGTLSVDSNGSISGSINAIGSNAILTFNNGLNYTIDKIFTVLAYSSLSTRSNVTTENRTHNAFGKFLCYEENSVIQNFEKNKTYTSLNGNWLSTNQITVTVHFGSDYSWELSENGVTGVALTQEFINNIINEIKIVHPEYLYGGIFIDSKYEQDALDITFYCDYDLYAKFEFDGYQILFESVFEETTKPANQNVYNDLLNGKVDNIVKGEVNSYEPNIESINAYDYDINHEYYFDGWYLDKECTSKYTIGILEYQNTDTGMKIQTLYAKWCKKFNVKTIVKTSESDNDDETYSLTVNTGGNKSSLTAETEIYVHPNSTIKVEFSGTNSKIIDVVNAKQNGQNISFDGCDRSITSTIEIQLNKKSSSTCFAKGTSIALANGISKNVEDLKLGDEILVYNHITGKLEASPIMVYFHSGYQEYQILKLYFDNGNSIDVIYGHSFFDKDVKKYVEIRCDNVSDYLDHSFICFDKENNICFSKLIGYEIFNCYTECYSLYTYQTYNHIANGFLAFTDDFIGIVNIFEMDDNYKYDEKAMEDDINKYGLYEYEYWKEYATYEEFLGFNIPYLKVAVGKGYICEETILLYLEIYHYYLYCIENDIPW
ncbi:MAG: hypothetical protein NC182_07940 [Prevotella sp.]|nr:hypothetical protein [Staphylococcus sp.]MCM1351105.1 hypothetical protein [Prevotella sp.]